MSSNQKTFTIILGMILTAVIIGMAISKQKTASNQNNNSQVLSQNSGVVDDHHKPVAAESAVFDGLLGKPAPDFTLSSYDGKKVSLKDFKGQNVILFFNEGLMCYPACWNQIVAFGKDNAFKDKNTVVLNITVDNKNDWKKAIDKMPELAGNTVLLDPNREVSTLYGVLALNSSMHRGQFPGHTYILIDKDGVVRFEKDDAQMAVRNQELLSEVAKL